MLNRLFCALWLLAAGLPCGRAAAPEDHPALRAAMEAAGLRPGDLFVDPTLRRRDPFRLKRVEEFMRHPLLIPDYLQELSGELANAAGTADAVRIAGAALELQSQEITLPVESESLMDTVKRCQKLRPLFAREEKSPRPRDEWRTVRSSRDLPPEVATIAARLLSATAGASEALRPAFEGLKPSQLKKLRNDWPMLVHWIRGNENIRDYDLELLSSLRAVDLARIVSVGEAWLRRVDAEVEALESWRASEKGKNFSRGGILLDESTPLGRVVIGGTGPNHYRDGEPPCLLIDLGGDDLYEIPVGSGHERVAVAIDLDGNDVYRHRGEATAGAGVLGLGALIDCAGNDRYETGDNAAGVACAGVGVLYDRAGDDDYICGETTLGAACYGVGLLIEEAGHDNYVGSHYSQAVAFTLGFGALVDRAGRDTYLCGRKVYGWSASENQFSAGGQGFAWGVREYGSGGIALLVDVSGDDTYYGNNLAQGFGYWF